MAGERMAQKITRILGSHPDLAFEFYCMASEIVDDFEDYGSVTQADDDGEYTDETTIGRLRLARNRLVEIMRNS